VLWSAVVAESVSWKGNPIRMPLLPLSDAVTFAFICMTLDGPLDGDEVMVLMYSGNFTLEGLAETVERMIRGEASVLEGAWGLCGKWSGTASCLCYVLTIAVRVSM
jgi:hypothetical protein